MNTNVIKWFEIQHILLKNAQSDLSGPEILYALSGREVAAAIDGIVDYINQLAPPKLQVKKSPKTKKMRAKNKNDKTKIKT